MSLPTQAAKLISQPFSRYSLFSISILILACAWYFSLKPSITITLIDFKKGLFEHPADIIEFKEKFWVTELLSSKIVQVDLGFSSISQVLTHPNPKKEFRSPHNIAIDENSLFFSAGWGSSIYIFDQSLSNFKEIPAKKNQTNIKLNAPHGICRQGNWLYIADSLNSRLIRMDINSLEKVEIFADHDKLIAYGRQLLCEKDSIWLSNSYEKREGLNTGNGSNVLKITDFNSGQAEVITQFLNTNITGIYLHQQRYLITAQWHTNSISIFDTKQKQIIGYAELPKPYAGVPYGMFFSDTTKRLYITYIGDIYGKQNKGGIGVYKITKKRVN